MKIIAHRGFTNRRPEHENSLAAFADAVALGADGVETDVRLTADRRLVLVHDYQTAGGEQVERLDYRQLHRATGRSVALLTEALAIWPDLFWNLELKTSEAAIELARLLRQLSMNRPLLVSSFLHRLMGEIEWPPFVERGLLIKHRIVNESAYLEFVKRSGLAEVVIWQREFSDREAVEQAAGLGLQNYAYGVDSGVDFETLADWDLAGVITDRPDRAIDMLGS